MAQKVDVLKVYLGGRFGYFLFFFCSGRGKGESRRRRVAGDRFFIEKPRRGALGTGGAGRVSAANWEFGGGGGVAKYFFSGPKCPPSGVFPTFQLLMNSCISFEARNPRTTPTKTMSNIAVVILGVVYILLLS